MLLSLHYCERSVCARRKEPYAAAFSAKCVFELSEKFPCTSGINLNLLCLVRELPRTVANLSYAEWEEAGLCSTSCFWSKRDLDLKPGKSFFMKDAKLAGIFCVS